MVFIHYAKREPSLMVHYFIAIFFAACQVFKKPKGIAIVMHYIVQVV